MIIMTPGWEAYLHIWALAAQQQNYILLSPHFTVVRLRILEGGHLVYFALPTEPNFSCQSSPTLMLDQNPCNINLPSAQGCVMCRQLAACIALASFMRNVFNLDSEAKASILLGACLASERLREPETSLGKAKRHFQDGVKVPAWEHLSEA